MVLSSWLPRSARRGNWPMGYVDLPPNQSILAAYSYMHVSLRSAETPVTGVLYLNFLRLFNEHAPGTAPRNRHTKCRPRIASDSFRVRIAGAESLFMDRVAVASRHPDS